MKKYIAVTLLFLVIITLIFYYNPSRESTPPPESKYIPLVTSPDEVIPVKSKPDKPKKEKTVKTVKRSSQDKFIYETITIEEAELKVQARKNITPIAAIEMRDYSIGTLQPDDTLLMPDIEGIDYTIKVTNVVKNSDGSITATGSYSDEGIRYTTTITRSQKVSFINLSTAQGSYEIETRNGVGYIYKTQSIRKQMQDTHLDDRIVLPLPKKP